MTTYLTTRKGNKLMLNGNRISGDTYPIKDALKTYCAAHDWDKYNKSWAVDLDKLNHYMSIANSIGLHIDTDQRPIASKRINGLCPKCHTYCYGDCEANS